MESMIDWDFAERTGHKLVRSGPEASAAEIAEAVAELREGAARSEQPVREFSDLHATSATAPVLVVDRAGWISANLEGFRTVMEPITAKMALKTAGGNQVVRGFSEKVAGAEMGALLAFMGTKVLGQFDPFWQGGAADTGRMLLVAPNIVQAERQLEVDPHDFRLWVCLHEETHRVQFTAVDWMQGHLRSLIGEFSDATDLDGNALGKALTQGISEITKLVRGDEDASLADLFQNDAQRLVVDKLTGVMSLLEGHADVVMDGVGPEVIPSVAEIRRKFTQRRKGAGGFDRVLRRLLGMDAKMRQYTDGADFVRAVNEKVGLSGFNAVWAEPANLPTRAEILEPASWVTRVHG
ncbi:zinc-dependent metalloprotease [soil metagenome]